MPVKAGNLANADKLKITFEILIFASTYVLITYAAMLFHQINGQTNEMLLNVKKLLDFVWPAVAGLRGSSLRFPPIGGKRCEATKPEVPRQARCREAAAPRA